MSLVVLTTITSSLLAVNASAEVNTVKDTRDSGNKEILSLLPQLEDKTEACGAEDYGLAKNIKDGVILHAWNWYFNDVKDNLQKIAEAGFTTVQVSPLQPNKDGTFTSTSQWWKFY